MGNVAPFGRCADDDFLAAPAFWADLDDRDAVANAADRYNGARPNIVVVTGKTPHPRVQLWWRLEEACTDAVALRAQNSALATAFAGDATVVNPGRVMALPGTVKWPIKPGRVIEMVELLDPADARTAAYMVEQIARAFPPGEPAPAQPAASTTATDFGVGVDPVEMLRAAKPGHWHEPMRAFTAHCVGAHYPDWLIIEAARQVLDDPNDPRDLERLIETARRKWGITDPGVGQPGTGPRKHPQKNDKETQGRALLLESPEPWPEPVDGAELLDMQSATFRQFVALPEHAAAALALWTLHTHCFEGGAITPRLAITSPQKGCGKTTVLDVLGTLVAKPLPAANVTPAAMFRVIEAARPTLLVDEADSFLKRNDELRGIINSGHAINGAVLRTVGDNHEPRQFSTWAPVAVAAIGTLPETITDRSIPIQMRRARPDEKVQKFRSDRPPPGVHDLVRKAARWADDNMLAVRESDPEMPGALYNRAADNWRILIAIADLAGGRWPKAARAAAVALSASVGAEDDSASVILLGDIRDLFDTEQASELTSEQVVAKLEILEDRPWPEWRHGKPITKRQLAKLLKAFGIVPRQLWINDRNQRGYDRADFEDTFVRYLPANR